MSSVDQWGSVEPSPGGTNDTTVLVTIEDGADEGRRVALTEIIKAICNAHGQPMLQVEVLEGSIAGRPRCCTWRTGQFAQVQST